MPRFPVGGIVKTACVTKLPKDVIAAYNAPFPDERYKAAARAFPRLVPTDADDPAIPANRAAWEELGRWENHSSPYLAPAIPCWDVLMPCCSATFRARQDNPTHVYMLVTFCRKTPARSGRVRRCRG